MIRGFVRSLSTAASAKPSLRVAIVGSGPSGFYAAKYLLKELSATGQIDILER